MLCRKEAQARFGTWSQARSLFERAWWWLWQHMWAREGRWYLYMLVGVLPMVASCCGAARQSGLEPLSLKMADVRLPWNDVPSKLVLIVRVKLRLGDAVSDTRPRMSRSRCEVITCTGIMSKRREAEQGRPYRTPLGRRGLHWPPEHTTDARQLCHLELIKM